MPGHESFREDHEVDALLTGVHDEVARLVDRSVAVQVMRGCLNGGADDARTAGHVTKSSSGPGGFVRSGRCVQHSSGEKTRGVVREDGVLLDVGQ